MLTLQPDGTAVISVTRYPETPERDEILLFETDSDEALTLVNVDEPIPFVVTLAGQAHVKGRRS